MFQISIRVIENYLQVRSIKNYFHIQQKEFKVIDYQITLYAAFQSN